MTKPIPDKAEIAVEYPDKLYIGTFSQTARFDAHFDEAGISLSLYRDGGDDTRKSVRMHFHYELFSEILRDLARTAASVPPAMLRIARRYWVAPRLSPRRLGARAVTTQPRTMSPS